MLNVTTVNCSQAERAIENVFTVFIDKTCPLERVLQANTAFDRCMSPRHKRTFTAYGIKGPGNGEKVNCTVQTSTS